MDLSWFGAIVAAGPALVVLTIITRCAPATTIRELGKNVYYPKVLAGTGHAWGPHSEVSIDLTFIYKPTEFQFQSEFLSSR